MDKYRETFETWNKLASLYQEKFMLLDIYNESYDYICESVTKPNARILDVGCGPGNITKYLLSKRPDFNILGIDMAPNMIKLAQENIPNASFRVMNIDKIPDLDTKFDSIVCGFCIPYLSEDECNTLILDAKELLHMGGYLYLSFVEGEPALSGFKTGSTGDRTFFYYHKLIKIQEQLILSGFGDIKIFKVGFNRSEADHEEHTIVIAKK